jgi:hypothetical protein
LSKVWTVEAHGWDEHYVAAVFSSEAAAEKFAAEKNAPHVEHARRAEQEVWPDGRPEYWREMRARVERHNRLMANDTDPGFHVFAYEVLD